MSTRTIQPTVVGRRIGDDSPKALQSPVGWIILAPVGSEIIDVTFDGTGRIIATLDRPVNGVDVELPLIVVVPGQEYTPLLGTTRGAFLGKAMMRGANGLVIVYVFKQDPWPTSTLEAVRAGGTA